MLQRCDSERIEKVMENLQHTENVSVSIKLLTEIAACQWFLALHQGFEQSYIRTKTDTSEL